MITRVVRCVAFSMTLLMLVCCGVPSSYVADTDPQLWYHPVDVRFENSDTTACGDLYIFVRHIVGVEEGEMRLSVDVVAPDTTVVAQDIVTMKLSRDVEERRNDHQTDEQIYRSDVVLNKLGEYKIVMRPISPLSGVEAVGVRVERKDGKR